MRQTTLHATRVSNPCILFWINVFSFLLLSYVTHIYRNFSTSTFVRHRRFFRFIIIPAVSITYYEHELQIWQ